MNTFRVIREVPADGVQVEAVSILKFLIFRLIDLNVTVLCFDQQISSGASVAFQSFFMDAVTLLDCRDHVGGLSLGPVAPFGLPWQSDLAQVFLYFREGRLG